MPFVPTPRSGARSRVLFAVGFAFLFSLFDLGLLCFSGQTPSYPVGYGIGDAREDESLWYLPYTRNFSRSMRLAGEPYLRERQDLPSLKPELPILLYGLLDRIVGRNTWLFTLLAHALIPIPAVLLCMALSRRLLAGAGSSILTVFSTLGLYSVCVAVQKKLHLISSQAEIPYFPGYGFFRSSPRPPVFPRFFSPGATSFFLFLSLLAIACWSDALKKQGSHRSRWSWGAGVAIALNLYAYPHNAFFAGCCWIAAFAREWIGPARPKIGSLLASGVQVVVAAVAASLPYAWQLRATSLLPGWADLRHRIVYAPLERFDLWPMLMLVILGVWTERKNPAKTNVPDSARSIWWTLTAGTVLTLVLGQTLAAQGWFPRPWLLGERIVELLFPLLLLSLAARWVPETRRVQALRWATGAAATWAILTGIDQLAAARRYHPLYAIPAKDQAFLHEVQASTPPGAIVAVPDLKQSVLLVNELDRFAFSPWGITSTSTHKELLERLMILSLLEGRDFTGFLASFRSGPGFANNWPDGELWVYHHGSPTYSPEEMRGLYQDLQLLSPEEVVKRYPLEFFYSKSGVLPERFRPVFAQVPGTHLFRFEQDQKR